MPSIRPILDILESHDINTDAQTLSLVQRLREAIDAGADVHEVTPGGNTLFWYIVRHPTAATDDLLKYLVETGKIDINQQIPGLNNMLLLERVIWIASQSANCRTLQHVLGCGAVVWSANLQYQTAGRDAVNALLDAARALDVEIAAIDSPEAFIDFLQRHPNDKLAFNRALSLISGLPRSHDLATGTPWTEAFYAKLREFVTWVRLNHPILQPQPGNYLTDAQVWQAFKEYLAGLSKASGSPTNGVLTGLHNPIVRKALEAGAASQPPNIAEPRIPLPRDVVDIIVGHPQVVTLFHRHLAEKQVRARAAAPANRHNRP